MRLASFRYLPTHQNFLEQLSISLAHTEQVHDLVGGWEKASQEPAVQPFSRIPAEDSRRWGR